MKNGSHNPGSKEDPSLSGLGNILANVTGDNETPLADKDDSQTGGDSGIGACGWLLFMISWLLVFVTLPFSLCVLIKVQCLQYSRLARGFTYDDKK